MISPVLFAAKSHASAYPCSRPVRDISSYSRPFPGNGNEYLSLHEATIDGTETGWVFAHHGNARGAVHVVPVIKDKKGNLSVLLLVAKRPPLGGQLSIELPGGLWGDTDPDETVVEGGARELQEETGYRAKKVVLLSTEPFATSGGMTDEEKSFVLAFAGPKRGKPKQDVDEQHFLKGEISVPLEVFLSPRKFEDSVAAAMREAFPNEEYIIGMDVPSGRGLMPPLKKNGKRLDLKA